MSIREATAADFPAILELNAASVHFLSPLDVARLQHLHRQAAYHRVFCDNGVVAAFLLAFREGADYDSPNYRWFAARYPAFLYIDLVVVADASRGCGLGIKMYEDLFAFARARNVARVACEFDLQPPNPRVGGVSRAPRISRGGYATSRRHRQAGFTAAARAWSRHAGVRYDRRMNSGEST